MWLLVIFINHVKMYIETYTTYMLHTLKHNRLFRRKCLILFPSFYIKTR